MAIYVNDFVDTDGVVDGLGRRGGGGRGGRRGGGRRWGGGGRGWRHGGHRHRHRHRFAVDRIPYFVDAGYAFDLVAPGCYWVVEPDGFAYYWCPPDSYYYPPNLPPGLVVGAPEPGPIGELFIAPDGSTILGDMLDNEPENEEE